MNVVLLANIHKCSMRFTSNELNVHGGHSQLQLHTPGTRYRLTLDLVILHAPLKNTSNHTCSDSLNLKPPAPLYPLQDFKALYKYCIIMVALCNRADHYIYGRPM